MVLGRRHIGNEVCVTNTVLLRSRMMRKYQVRFWRAAALVRESPTLIVAADQNIRNRGISLISTVGQTGIESACAADLPGTEATESRQVSKSRKASAVSVSRTGKTRKSQK